MVNGHRRLQLIALQTAMEAHIYLSAIRTMEFIA